MKNWIAAMLLILVASFSGCAKKPEERMVGHWKLCGLLLPNGSLFHFSDAEAMQNRQAATILDNFRKESSSVEITFQRDGMAKAQIDAKEDMFQWSIQDGKEVLLTGPEQFKWPFRFKGNDLLLNLNGPWVVMCQGGNN